MPAGQEARTQHSPAVSREITVTLTDRERALLAEAAGTFMFVSIGAGAIVTHFMTDGGVGLVGIALGGGPPPPQAAITIAERASETGFIYPPSLRALLRAR